MRRQKRGFDSALGVLPVRIQTFPETQSKSKPRYEVVNGLRRFTVAREITPDRAGQALNALWELGIEFFGDDALHQQALAVAHELGLRSAYDAHYIALAQRLGAPLWTRDHRLADAARSCLPAVHLPTG